MKRNNPSISKLIIVLLVIAGMAAAFCFGRMVGANEVKDRSHQDHHADTTAEEDNDQYSDDSSGDYWGELKINKGVPQKVGDPLSSAPATKTQIS